MQKLFQFGMFGTAALIVVAVLAGDAAANSKFTVENTASNRKVQIDVFNGNDGVCFSGSTHRVNPGEKHTYKCEGHGTGRCKVRFRNVGNHNVICRNKQDTCDGNGIIIKDNGFITIHDTSDGGVNCTVSD